MYIFVSLVIFLLFLAFLWVKKSLSFWTSHGFLQATANFPFGTLKDVGTKVNACERMKEVYDEFKGKSQAVGIYFFLQPALLVLDPELMKSIFVKDFASFSHRGFYHNRETDPISCNLLTLEGQEWRNRRNNFSPIFSSGKIKMMFEIVNLMCDKLVEAVDEDMRECCDVEVREWSRRFTADTIGNVVFGLECNCLKDADSEYMKKVSRLFEISPFELLKTFFANCFPNAAKTLKLRLNPKEPTDFFAKIFTDTFEFREKNEMKRNDFVSLLLGLKDNFSPMELAAEAFLFYAAGFDTSSILISFTFYELAMNEEIQERLRDEILSGIEENEGKITYDLLFGFKYLDMVVNECLRKYPPLPFHMRKCTKDFNIPGTDLIIPEGSPIQIPLYGMHHDPEYFPQPEKFDPERFNEENVKNIAPFVFTPFGEGPRNCIGMRFALLQSKLAIVKMLQRFKFSPCDKTTITLKLNPSPLVLTPMDGIWLKLDVI